MTTIRNDFTQGKHYYNTDTQQHIIIVEKMPVVVNALHLQYLKVLISDNYNRYWEKLIDLRDLKEGIENDVIIPLFNARERGYKKAPKQPISITINL